VSYRRRLLQAGVPGTLPMPMPLIVADVICRAERTIPRKAANRDWAIGCVSTEGARATPGLFRCSRKLPGMPRRLPGRFAFLSVFLTLSGGPPGRPPSQTGLRRLPLELWPEYSGKFGPKS
jgi:hypothetical protein